MAPFPQQWHVTNKSGYAAIYGYIWSTFSPRFVDVRFLWDFVLLLLVILHEANVSWPLIQFLFLSVKLFKREYFKMHYYLLIWRESDFNILKKNTTWVNCLFMCTWHRKRKIQHVQSASYFMYYIAVFGTTLRLEIFAVG